MGSNMNLLQLIQLMQNNPNPQQFVIDMLEKQTGGNPMFQSFIELAKAGKGNELEQVARNMCKERGVDFDQEFGNFKKNLKLFK